MSELTETRKADEGKKAFTHEEWLAEGKRRFGEDYEKWQFICPVCGNIAAMGDYRAYADKGATPNSATCECIGRYAGGRSALDSKKERPCDYAGYGLFRFSPVRVTMPDGITVHCFAFAEPAEVTREQILRDLKTLLDRGEI